MSWLMGLWGKVEGRFKGHLKRVKTKHLQVNIMGIHYTTIGPVGFISYKDKDSLLTEDAADLGDNEELLERGITFKGKFGVV